MTPLLNSLFVGFLGCKELSHWIKVGVSHGFFTVDSLVLVVLKHLLQQVQSLGRNHMLVVFVYKRRKGHLLVVVILNSLLDFLGDFDAVALHVLVQFVFSEDLDDADQLVKVVAALEERVHLEYHAGHGAPEGPDVEAVVV